MSSRVVLLSATSIAALLVIGFFFAPLVGYTQSVDIWYAYKDGWTSCNPQGGVINVTSQQEYQRCLASYKYPPTNITGSSTLAYKLLNLGAGPFPSQTVVTQGNYSVMVYFRGDRAVAAESLWYEGPGGVGGLVVNPTNMVSIENASFAPLPFGQVGFTVTLRNIGSVPIVAWSGAPLVVSVQFPGTGYNQTEEGLVWIGPAPVGECPGPWEPGGSCRLSADFTDLLPPGQPFTFYVEVRGMAGGSPFFYRQEFHTRNPQQTVSSGWVTQFIDMVEKNRSGVFLWENTTLDRFASLRFSTAVSQPDVSDFGFASDAETYFGGVSPGTGVVELLLFPGATDPYSYSVYLQQYAPVHWSELVNQAYTQYGYFVGRGPYEFVNQPCPVSEIPAGGLNITQYFSQAGCTVSTREATWLVMILGR